MTAERVMAGEERDQNAGKAVAGRQIGVGASLHGGDLDHAGEAGGGAGEETSDEMSLPTLRPDDLGGADIAAGDARRRTETV